MKNAKQYAIDNCAMVRSDVVFGWIDEYVGLDDKKEAEEEAKANEKIKAIKDKAVGKTEEKKEEPTQASIFDLF